MMLCRAVLHYSPNPLAWYEGWRPPGQRVNITAQPATCTLPIFGTHFRHRVTHNLVKLIIVVDYYSYYAWCYFLCH